MPRTLSLLALSLFAGGALVVSACTSDDSAVPPASGDASTSSDSSSGTDGTTTPVDGASSSDGGGSDGGNPEPGDAGTDAPVTDAGFDATDTGPDAGCASVRATPIFISGNISADTSWTCDNVYLVHGVVEVLSPATLTIAPGTTVLMSSDTANDGNLIIAPGAKLMAVGTSDLPIVFTSSAMNVGATPAPGDWGSVDLVGLAPGNWGAPGGVVEMSGSPDDSNNFPSTSPFPFTAGSNDPSHSTDSSGTLMYVRMEYGGGVKLSNDAGVSGSSPHEMLGLYGVGSGTLLDYVDLRQANYGCLFAMGGQFRGRHLICQTHGESGGFDFSRGNQSQLQFLLVQENQTAASPNSEGIGLKGPHDANVLPPLTAPTIYNVTTCGSFGVYDAKDPYAFLMTRAPSGQIANFIGSGYAGGLAMQNSKLADGGFSTGTTMQSSLLFDNFAPGGDGGVDDIDDPTLGPYDTDLSAWFFTSGWKNATTDPGIVSCQNETSLQAYPTTAITTNAATPPASSDDGAAAFFDSTATYIGAFKDGTDTWASGGWVVWSNR